MFRFNLLFTSLLILFAMILLTANNLNAFPRKVLFEEFTSTTCSPCAAAAGAVEAGLEAVGDNRVASVAFHMSWPAPGNDPWYHDNTEDNNGRRQYYGVNAIPTYKIDGVTYGGARIRDAFRDAILNRGERESPLEMSLSGTVRDGELSVDVSVLSIDGIDNLDLFIALAEEYWEYRGAAGQTDHYDAMVKMIPDADGTNFDIEEDEELSWEYVVEMEDLGWHELDPENLQLVVWAQNADREVIQAQNYFLEGEEAPVIVVEPEAMDFGEIEVDAIGELSLTIRNDGDDDLTVSDITVEGNYFSADFDAEFVLAPDESYELTVIFAPEEEGEFEGTLTITSDDPQNPEVEVEFFGVCIFIDHWDPWLDEAHDFGSLYVGESAEWVFTIRNLGRRDLLIDSISVEGSYYSLDNEGEFVLEPDESVDITVTFAPEDAGVFDGIVTIVANNPDEGEIVIELTGEGVWFPIIRVEPEEIDFGLVEVDELETRVLTIRNDGRETLSIFELSINNDAFGPNLQMGELQFDWEFVETEGNMSIVVRDAEIEGEALVEGDYVGVFTPGGICAGFVQIDADGFPIGVSAWGDDVETEEVEGFRVGEQLNFRLWSSQEENEAEYAAEAEFQAGAGVYTAGDIAEVILQSERLLRRGGVEAIEIEPDESTEVEITFAPVEEREYEGTLTITSDDPDNEELTVPLNGTGVRGEITVSLGEGWNMISINVIPGQEMYREGQNNGPDVIRMMEQLRVDEDNHLLFILKNEGGRFYLPHVPFNNIPYWELTEGYQVRVLEDCEATWAGEQIPADADIPIDEGWNIIAYFPTYDLPIESPDFYAISPILDHVIMIKNIAGRFAKPDIPFSNMPPLTPGQGYQIRVDEDVMLNYPEEMLEEHPPYFAGGDENGKPLGGRTFSPPLHGHWTEPEPTGRNMSVLVTSISSFNATIGDQVAAFGLDGQLVGVGEFNADGLCGLAVWGDDESTNEVEGLRDGEKFALRLWDNDQQEEKNLLVTGLQVGTLTYETDGFTALETDAISPVPTEFSLASAYPNPFNMATKLKFNLPVESWVNIRVFDIAGKQVTTIFDGKQPAGFHTATWNSQDASSGIYFVKMESSGFSAVRKLVLMK